VRARGVEVNADDLAGYWSGVNVPVGERRKPRPAPRLS
jgi:hypothetical protein